VANIRVNVDNSFEIGSKIIKSMEFSPVHSYVFKKKDRAITMDSNSKVDADKDLVSVDRQLLFQRIISSIQGIGPVWI